MGKSTKRSTAAELKLVLTQTANDASRCLKVLTKNLGSYDRRHKLHLLNTTKHFMRNDIRVAKDMIRDMRFVAKRIRKKNDIPSKSEVTAARNSMNSTADALNDLKNAGRVYDQNHDNSGGVAGIISNVFGGDTVEAVVRSTLRDSFSGFTALNAQVLATENTLSPSIATHAKATVAKVANKIAGDPGTSPTDEDDSV